MEIPKVFVNIRSGVTVTSSAAFNLCYRVIDPSGNQVEVSEVFKAECPKHPTCSEGCPFKITEDDEDLYFCTCKSTPEREVLFWSVLKSLGYRRPGEEEDLPSFNAADLGNLLE